MKKVLIGLIVFIGLVAIGGGIAAAVVINKTNTAMETPAPDIDVPALDYAEDTTALTNGAHLFVTRGCADCHGDQGQGKTVIDAQPMGTFSGSNLTAGKGGKAGYYNSVTDWHRAIRYGVAPDNRKLVFMPAHETVHYSNRDMAALIAYVQSLEPVDNTPKPIAPGIITRVLWLSGQQFPLIPADMIDLGAEPAPAPATGATVAYGDYLLKMCVGCHGNGLSGGKIPGGDPNWPAAANLTPHETGLGSWDYGDFETAMRQGTRPDGSEINEIMPTQSFGNMHDWELEAMWMALQEREPAAHGNR